MIDLDLDKLDFTRSNGLVTIVTQHAVTGVVLMIAHADREAVEKTISTGEMHYRSRTRGLWHKGATSGNIQRVVSLSADCDNDAILARVIPSGPSCHTMSESCFGQTALGSDALSMLDQTIAERARSLDNAGTSTSYTRKLLGDRNLRLKKIGEETAELLTALADVDPDKMSAEAADLFYHMLVALRANGTGLDDVRAVLAKRAGQR
jgi:phosphoribosyl-ATP pyrophosphohydrolase/phosphoribosyl-AMP cyclohydrolase